jgi:hypothetical protein
MNWSIKVGTSLKCGGNVASNVDGLLSKAPAKLGYVGNCNRIQGPEGVLVERLDALAQTDLDAVSQKVVLSE